jgi:hypothetical protein
MLTVPPLIEAKPGDPITAEGWNNIRTAVLALFDVLNKSFGSLTVVVKAKGAGTIVDFATVTAVPTNGGERPFRIAQFAGASVQLYQIQNLLPGKYDLVVEAPGFAKEVRPIVMDDTGSSQQLSIEMTPTEVTLVMPNLFGLPVNVAMDQATSAGLIVARIIDSYGTDIAPSGIPEPAKASPVLNQVPEAGEFVAKNTPVQLHISAKVAQQVKVPSLAGLTIAEAKAQLEALGLVVGETNTIGK